LSGTIKRIRGHLVFGMAFDETLVSSDRALGVAFFLGSLTNLE
jgi:hypothetical protein